MKIAFNGYWAFLAIFGAVVLAMIAYAQPHWIVAAAAFAWLLLFAAFNLLEREADRTRILGLLAPGGGLGLYTRLVDRVLGLVGRMMAPEVREEMPRGRIARWRAYLEFTVSSEGERRRLRESPFGWPTADAALKLAIIYPLFALLVQWAWTAGPTGIAGVPILPAEERLWLRLAATCPLALYLGAAIMASAIRTPRWETASGWLFMAALAAAVAFAGAVAAAVAFAGAGTVAFAFAGAVAVAGAVAGAAAAAVAFAFAGAFAGAVAFAFAGAVAVAGAVAAAVAAAVGRAVRHGRGLVAYLCLAVFAAAALIALLIAAPSLEDGANLRLLIFALALLPLINAVFDYLSYGTTIALLGRGLWRRGDRGLRRVAPTWRVLGWGLVDLAAAFAYLVGLGFVLTGVVALINFASGVPLLDLPQVFADLRDPAARGAYGWLILACLTTLVPTLAHFAIAALSAPAWLPDAARARLRRRIESDSDIDTFAATAAAATVALLALAAMIGGPLLVAMFVAGGLTGPFGLWDGTFGIGTVGLLVLDCVEALANLAGVTTRPPGVAI